MTIPVTVQKVELLAGKLHDAAAPWLTIGIDDVSGGMMPGCTAGAAGGEPIRAAQRGVCGERGAPRVRGARSCTLLNTILCA